MSHLPSIFIGSSTEGLEIAQEVESRLFKKANIQIWNDNIFQPGIGILERLVQVVEKFDFAIMIISADDFLKSRDQMYESPRDNVLFEMGLFMGRLGRERTFVIHEENPKMKVPSDLFGVSLLSYRIFEGVPKVGPACTEIGKVIDRLGLFEKKQNNMPDTLKAYDEVNDALVELRGKIVKREINVIRAELIQHSSERTFTLISAMASANANIELYLQHPDLLNLVCCDLKPRVISRLRHYPQELKKRGYNGNFEVYLYNTPASFNGIRIWKEDGTALLIVSWYTYIHNLQSAGELKDCKISGSENPCVVLDTTHPYYVYFERFFNDLISNFKAQGSPPVYSMKAGQDTWQEGWPNK